MDANLTAGLTLETNRVTDGVVEDEPVLGEILGLRRTGWQRMGKAVERRREGEQEEKRMDGWTKINPMEKKEKSATAPLKFLANLSARDLLKL